MRGHTGFVALQRINELSHENAVLARELAAAQQRSTRLQAHHSRQLEQVRAALMRLRAELICRDTLIAALRDELHTRRVAGDQPAAG